MVTPSPRAAAIPKRLADFELLEMLGQGGMGTVFRARQVSLDRIVAVKILNPSLARNEQFILRFQREARLSGRLDHPHIVQGIDVGLDAPSGLWYFAMEFIDGPTLQQVIERDGPLHEERTIEVGLAIASALDAAARQGIVHRDIKPDNILLNEHGQPKLADLGMAKPMSGGDSSLTQSGTVLGTPYYMAPEQIRGAENEVDSRTDLYALGATLFCLVTGHPPFEGESSAVVMAMHLNDKPPLAHQVCDTVSEGLSRILHKAMQKDRTKRLQNPSEFKTSLEELRACGPTRTTRAAPGTALTRKTGHQISVAGRRQRSEARPASGRRSGAAPWFLLGGSVAFAGFALWFFASGSPPPPPLQAARKATPEAEPTPDDARAATTPPIITEQTTEPAVHVESRTAPIEEKPEPTGAARTEPEAPEVVAHWTFDALEGATIPDRSGHGFDLHTDKGVQLVAGHDRMALKLTGPGNARIVSAKHVELGGADFSLSAWVKTSRGGCILSKASGDAWQKDGKIFYIHGSGGPPGALRFDSHSVACASARTSLLDDRWHHVAVTFLRASSEIRLYVDGREDRRVTLKLKPDPAGFEVRLGWGPEHSFTTSFDGLLDDVRVYERVLSAQEIHALYSPPAP